MKILFVCIGNICRSPIAEGVLKHKCHQSKLDWIIDSAGTHSYHIGEPPHKSSHLICEQNGIDISYQRARQFNESDFKKFDKIYAFATDVYDTLIQKANSESDKSKIILLLDELYKQKGKSVKDPWYGGFDDYEDVFEEINLVCEAIINKHFN